MKLSWMMGALLALGAAAGCNGNKIDCAQVCSAYADCIDSEFDVRTCTRTCEAEADASEDREERLEECESCIEGQSCTEQVACTSECAGVIDITN